MALKTVSQYKDSVAGILSGIDLNNVSDLNGALERGARVLVQQADIPEASGIQNIVLYGGVYDYACDPRIFGTAINDIRPQGVSRPVSDFVYKRPGEQFDRTKGYLRNGTMATFEYSNGIPIIRIVSKQTQQQIVIDFMNSTSGWSGIGAATSPIQDNAVYYQAPASLRFNLTAGFSSGSLTKNLSSSIDLSSYQGVGVAFLAVRFPEGNDFSNFENVSLFLGSDDSNYSTVTVSEGFLGAFTSGDWLLVAFDFSTASLSGTPNWSAIDYVNVNFANNEVAMINLRVGGLWICQPNPAQILYQSAAIFKAGSSEATTSITTDADQILLNDPAYNLFLYEGAIAILENVGGAVADSSKISIEKKLYGNGVNDFGLYGKFRGDNPSQELRTVGNYYDDGAGYGYGGY